MTNTNTLHRWLAAALCVLLLMAVCRDALAWKLVCDRDPSHDAYELSGFNKDGTVVSVDAFDHRLEYPLDGLPQGIYKIQARAFNQMINAWSSWSEPFFLSVSGTGECESFDQVAPPSGLNINKD